MQVLNFLNCRIIGNTRNNASHTKQQLASNCDTVISRFALQEKNIYESFWEAGPNPPFACKFRKDKNLDLLVVANEDGEVMLIDTSKDDDNVNAFTAHHNAIYDICWLSDKYHLITVSGDHRACLWDMNTLKKIGSFKRHTESIKSVDACPNDNDMFATGSRDGTICVWDIRDGKFQEKPSIHIQSVHCRKALNKSQFPFNKKLSSSVSAVAFQDKINLASTGSIDSVVKIWDMRKTYISKPTYIPSPRYQMKYEDDKKDIFGYTSLAFDSIYRKLYASSTANKILMFNCSTYSNAEIHYDGFECNTYYIKLALSDDDQYLACGSSNNKAYVWKTNKPGHPQWEFSGHTSEVTTVAWGYHDITKFVTCGDDNQILIWKTINHENTEQLNKSLITASEYSNSSTSSWDTVSPPAITPNPTPIQKRVPTKKTIKSFFQPVSSAEETYLDLSMTHTSDYHSNDASLVEVLSPSKKANPNIHLSPESCSLPSKSQGKENHSSSTKDSSSKQIKRKSFRESTPVNQRSFKRRKKNGSNVKKQQNSEGNIRNYFTSSLSPKE